MILPHEDGVSHFSRTDEVIRPGQLAILVSKIYVSLTGEIEEIEPESYARSLFVDFVALLGDNKCPQGSSFYIPVSVSMGRRTRDRVLSPCLPANAPRIVAPQSSVQAAALTNPSEPKPPRMYAMSPPLQDWTFQIVMCHNGSSERMTAVCRPYWTGILASSWP